ARIEDDGQCQPLLLKEGTHTLGCLIGVGGQGDHGGLALMILGQLGKDVLHVPAAVARRAPERQDNDAVLGPRRVLLQFAEFDVLAVEGPNGKIRHVVADLDEALGWGFVLMLAAVVMLVLHVLVAVYFVVVPRVFLPLVAGRPGFGMLGVLAAFLHLLVRGVGCRDRGRLLLRAAAEHP